jgi:hypothetical protein
VPSSRHTSGTAITEFGIRVKKKADLIERGRATAANFLRRWGGGSA